jgi:peptidoglycan/xylan/chitin deacetylase (PgdA/CDA1 family)
MHIGVNFMLGLTFKKKLAKILEIIGFNDSALFIFNKIYKNNYIRVINYHETYLDNRSNFENHIIWYKSKFENCALEKLTKFLNRQYEFKEKPGLIITFDDGYIGNYFNAYPLLKKYGFTGYFYVSTGLIGNKNYMDDNMLKDLIKNNHVIGCHTYTHHRMGINDKDEILKKEIVDSKLDLEKLLIIPVDIFCWVGGEEGTYTEKAAEYIRKAGYKFSMMTNSKPVIQNSDRLQINRTNVNDDWELSLIKFQLSGLIDLKYYTKRKRVNHVTKG